jgi:hypothetical protein
MLVLCLSFALLTMMFIDFGVKAWKRSKIDSLVFFVISSGWFLIGLYVCDKLMGVMLRI